MLSQQEISELNESHKTEKAEVRSKLHILKEDHIDSFLTELER